MLALLALLLIVAASFAAGYATRAAVSHKRRARYLKWEPYVRPSRPSPEPPAFLVQGGPNKNFRSVEGGRASSNRVAGSRT